MLAVQLTDQALTSRELRNGSPLYLVETELVKEKPEIEGQEGKRLARITHYRYDGDLSIFTLIDLAARSTRRLDVMPHVPVPFSQEEYQGASELALADARVRSALGERAAKVKVEGLALRTADPADRFFGHVIPLNDIAAQLALYDIIICCTASPLPIVGKGADNIGLAMVSPGSSSGMAGLSSSENGMRKTLSTSTGSGRSISATPPHITTGRMRNPERVSKSSRRPRMASSPSGKPTSSSSSRNAACTVVSPASSRPPGNANWPL